MHKTQRRRVLLAIGILCCFMLELVSGPRLHGKTISPAGHKETGFLFQKSNLFCQYAITDESSNPASNPVISKGKNYLNYFSFSQAQQTAKYLAVVSYTAHNTALFPSYTSTVIIFPFHYFW